MTDNITAASAITTVAGAGNPTMRICETHGRYYAFTCRLPNGLLYESKCPACKAEEDDGRPRALSIEVGSVMVRNRLIEAGVPEDMAAITVDTMPPALRQITQAMDAVKIIARGELHNLVMLGPNGVGKTTLAVAALAQAAEAALASGRQISMHYTTEARLLRALKTTFSRKDGPSEQDIIDRMGRVTILVIDEIGKVRSNDYNMLAIEEIINIRHQTRATIICGNPSLNDFRAHLTDSSRSKLAMNGTLIEIEDRDHRREP